MSEKLKLGAKTAIDIDKLRDGYRPAARRGAILFFILADLSTINTMYQYSLDAYLGVFELSLKKSMPDAILQKRLKNIMDTLTHNIYNYGCTGDYQYFKLLIIWCSLQSFSIIPGIYCYCIFSLVHVFIIIHDEYWSFSVSV